jgi:hypothetical protein
MHTTRNPLRKYFARLTELYMHSFYDFDIEKNVNHYTIWHIVLIVASAKRAQNAKLNISGLLPRLFVTMPNNVTSSAPRMSTESGQIIERAFYFQLIANNVGYLLCLYSANTGDARVSYAFRRPINSFLFLKSTSIHGVGTSLCSWNSIASRG